MSGDLHIPGVDFQGGVRRTGGSRVLYLRFLKRFPEDDSFARLPAFLEAGDVQGAFHAAHTLKGLAAQLSITALAGPASELCELLRPLNPAALPEAKERFLALAPVYREIIAQIRRLP